MTATTKSVETVETNQQGGNSLLRNLAIAGGIVAGAGIIVGAVALRNPGLITAGVNVAKGAVTSSVVQRAVIGATVATAVGVTVDTAVTVYADRKMNNDYGLAFTWGDAVKSARKGAMRGLKDPSVLVFALGTGLLPVNALSGRILQAGVISYEAYKYGEVSLARHGMTYTDAAKAAWDKVSRKENADEPEWKIDLWETLIAPAVSITPEKFNQEHVATRSVALLSEQEIGVAAGHYAWHSVRRSAKPQTIHAQLKRVFEGSALDEAMRERFTTAVVEAHKLRNAAKAA